MSIVCYCVNGVMFLFSSFTSVCNYRALIWEKTYRTYLNDRERRKKPSVNNQKNAFVK